MDISWGAIGKILLAGIATYVLLPAVLIIRDAVLWKLINKFILTSKLQLEIRRYVELIHDWNTKYAGEACISSTDTVFFNRVVQKTCFKQPQYYA